MLGQWAGRLEQAEEAAALRDRRMVALLRTAEDLQRGADDAAVLAARTDEAHRALAAVGQRLGGAEQLIHRLAVTIHGGGAGRGPLATYEGVLRALSPDARVRCPRPSDLTCGICICSRPLRS
eukprot:COSAG04_NODE_891_length_9607_cov_13.087085_13_plen_123_part_00